MSKTVQVAAFSVIGATLLWMFVILSFMFIKMMDLIFQTMY